MLGISPKPLTKETVVEALNREIIPLLRELRQAILDAAGDTTVAVHAETHEAGGDDMLAGELIAILFSPVNYVAMLPLLANHLLGIDDELSPYLVYIPETAAHVFAFEDKFKTILCLHGAAVTHLLPLDASVPYPVGTVIRFLWRGAGQPTISGVVGVTVVAPDGAKVSAQNKFVFAEKIVANTWLLSGSCAV
jgi:hypothetical protein